MYTNDEEKKGLPIKTFLMSLILIIIFVLLLIWLLPMPDVKGINDRIFNANIQEMKNAAIPYFTTDKLPQEEGDSVTLTLQEMLDLKLLLPFTDKNGDSCNTKESYVTLTKKADHYELKVFLKCNGQEDYILVTLGCYSYCTSAVCEKDKQDEEVKPQENGPSCYLYVSNGDAGSNGWYRSNVTVKFRSKTASTGEKITNYGIGTGKLDYNGKDSFTVSNDGSTTVYGYVKDSKGKTATCSVVVKKDTVKPSCSLSVLSGTKGNDGSYVSDVVVGFSNRTDAASGVNAYGLIESTTPTYNGKAQYTVSTNGDHKVYGYVRDNAGNTATCDASVKVNKPATPSTSIPSCTLKVASGTLGSNGWYLGNTNVEFATKTTTNGATITGYGLGTSENYSGNNNYSVTNDGTTTVYGYVKDSNGKTATCSIVVKKDAVKPNCSLVVKNGTFNSNGYYTTDVTVGFSSKVDATSGVSAFGIGKAETYAGNTTYTATGVGKHTVYGYVKDQAGNTNVCSISFEKRNNLEYQYKKDIAAQYSAWGDWTTHVYTPDKKPNFGTFELAEVVDLGMVHEIDYYKYEKGDPIYQDQLVKVGTINQTYCAGYNYYRPTTSTTTTTYAVKIGEDWQFAGMVTTTGVPTSTLTVKYEFVGFDWSECGTGCSRAPKKIWNKYVRNVYIASSNTITTTTGQPVATCSSTETKQVEIFATAHKLIGYEEAKIPVYRDVYKFKERRRTLTQAARTDYRWSIYNDQTLLSQGYTMTGNTRVVD